MYTEEKKNYTYTQPPGLYVTLYIIVCFTLKFAPAYLVKQSRLEMQVIYQLLGPNSEIPLHSIYT